MHNTGILCNTYHRPKNIIIRDEYRLRKNTRADIYRLLVEGVWDIEVQRKLGVQIIDLSEHEINQDSINFIANEMEYVDTHSIAHEYNLKVGRANYRIERKSASKIIELIGMGEI